MYFYIKSFSGTQDEVGWSYKCFKTHPLSRWFTLLTVLRWMVPVLVLLFVALSFIIQSDYFYVLPCVCLYLWFSILLEPRFGNRELKFSAFHTFVD